MSEIIASTYELMEKIGFGGGGNVYLANHLRLNKKVVLKADKRKLNTRPELLRREVDVLKNLSHTYIPKVYDFFVENETVYTVMDYIDGTSLDKPLKNGQLFPQAQVIEWAKQLLQALDYLHSPIHGELPKGYVHSDIKPANIMLTSLGTVCLIDFNIALALEEENVIGCSAGYASPEHYGLDYSSGPDTAGTGINGKLAPNVDATVLMNENGSAVSLSSTKRIVPDVRSDIYSLGATLYHLLSGVKPARSAVEVVPLSEKKFSTQIVEIISKAMQPTPDLRYQSAKEMLYDLEHLHENDPRYKRKRKAMKIVCACFGLLFAAGIFSSFTGLKRIQARESALKLTEYSRDSLARGKTDKAVEYALEALSQKGGIFSPAPSAKARLALTDALGVYNLSEGYKPYKTAELPSAPLFIALSPKGKTVACVCAGEVILTDTESAEIILRLEAENSALSEVRFLSENVIVYAAAGGIRAYDLENNTELWSGEEVTSISVSGGGEAIAAVYKDRNYAVIYNGRTGELAGKIDFEGKGQSIAINDTFADPDGNLFALSSDGKFLAVSFSDGSLKVFDTENDGNDLDIFGENSGFTRFEGGFYGKYLAFSASNKESSAVAVIDCEKKEQTGGFRTDGLFSVKTDENGIYVNQDNLLVKLDPVSGNQTALAITKENLNEFTVNGDFSAASAKNKFMFFDKKGNEISSYNTDFTARFLLLREKTALVGFSDSPVIRILTFEDNADKTVVRYDCGYDYYEARISPDGTKLMLFSNGGFAVYGIDGTLICEKPLPDGNAIYDQQYKREGNESYLEVTYYDGSVLKYDGRNGTLISEDSVEPPEKDLYEQFYTDAFLIKSPLHGTPTAYDKKTGALVSELEEDAYLTYITEEQDCIIAQYISTDGRRFGVLMNEKCEKIAELPYLCDVYNGELYFDYPSGAVRKTEIYGFEELVSMAEIRLRTN